MGLLLRYNALSMLARPTSTLSSIALIAVIIAVFAYLQAVTDSAFNTLAGTGDPGTIIILSQSATSETVSGLAKDSLNKLEAAPGLVREGDNAVISPELVAISSAKTVSGDEVAVNVAVRGVDFDRANRVRRDRVKIIAGRPFEPGTAEVIIGEAAHALYRDHDIGQEIQLGTRGSRMFKIVGVFSTGGTAADSEVWGYVETLRDVYGRTRYSSARALAVDEPSMRQAIDYIEGPAVGLTAKSEQDYFRELNTNQTATQVLAIAMIIIMGIAAAFAIANTMYAAVAGRTREIGMLRALGFGRTSILTSFVIEGLLIATAGGLIGCALSLVCDGMRRNMLPTTFTTVSYTLHITPQIMVTSLVIAMAIGVAGSIMPASRAARFKVIEALRQP